MIKISRVLAHYENTVIVLSILVTLLDFKLKLQLSRCIQLEKILGLLAQLAYKKVYLFSPNRNFRLNCKTVE
jgi:hypothetical protein